MWEYLAVLLIGFWLGVALFLYISCYWLEEILDLPHRSRSASPSKQRAHHSGEGGASGAHAQLKRLVARVVEEAAALPALAQYAAEPTQTPSLESSTYEDLLATAILNKVIERYQTENGSGGRSSGIHSASASPSPSELSSPHSLHSRNTREISPPLREEEDESDWEEGNATDETLEMPRRVPFPEFGGDIVHHTDTEEFDFDEISSSDIQAADGSWEENWLFQKKKIKTSQSVPVPMLVPNSNTDYKVLIGDRDVDDTTDLSDNASDAEDHDLEYKSDIKRVLDSKHVIGGKMKIDDVLDFEPDSLTIDESSEFDKTEGHEHTNSTIIDAVNKDINDNCGCNELSEDRLDERGSKSQPEKDSVLIISIDSGPLSKAEFSLKEEIHRTALNGNTQHEDQGVKTNCEIYNDSFDSFSTNKGSTSTLSRHEKEGEYEEAVSIPVQRYADSLRRKHFDDDTLQIPTRDTDTDELIPGSIAYRERKKWLNYVEMPNNPYSPEAIKKRLTAKSASSLFDTLTSNKNSDDGRSVISIDAVDGKISREDETDVPVKEINHKNQSLNVSIENISMNGTRSKSPSPKILKDLLAEEVPQYKRYGRDYYIREARASSGGRKKNSFSDTSSISSMNKSTSLDNFDIELASPVSASSSLSDLEATALHQNIVRNVLSPRNASPNFAINPIFEHPDKQFNADENHTTYEHSDSYSNVRNSNVCDGGDGYVENEDILRLKIPNKPEITEDLFETYNRVRRSNTLRSDDLYFRSKRRTGFNHTFGGSLRLSRSFRTDLW